jgi:hypothetical protein
MHGRYFTWLLSYVLHVTFYVPYNWFILIKDYYFNTYPDTVALSYIHGFFDQSMKVERPRCRQCTRKPLIFPHTFATSNIILLGLHVFTTKSTNRTIFNNNQGLCYTKIADLIYMKQVNVTDDKSWISVHIQLSRCLYLRRIFWNASTDTRPTN